MPKKLKVNYMDHWYQRDGNAPWEELGYSDYQVYQQLLKVNANLVEITFSIDRKRFAIIRNAIPVIGISYDVFKLPPRGTSF